MQNNENEYNPLCVPPINHQGLTRRGHITQQELHTPVVNVTTLEEYTRIQQFVRYFKSVTSSQGASLGPEQPPISEDEFDGKKEDCNLVQSDKVASSAADACSHAKGIKSEVENEDISTFETEETNLPKEGEEEEQEIGSLTRKEICERKRRTLKKTPRKLRSYKICKTPLVKLILISRYYQKKLVIKSYAIQQPRLGEGTTKTICKGKRGAFQKTPRKLRSCKIYKSPLAKLRYYKKKLRIRRYKSKDLCWGGK